MEAPSFNGMTESLTGKLLLAMPGIGDPRFERAAILVCNHDADGAIGIGLGRPSGLRLRALLGKIGVEPGAADDLPVLAGGPVEPQRGFVVHGLDWRSDETLDFTAEWGLSGTLDVLRAIADGTGPARYLVALGYAGWGPGQLDGELTRHGWFVADADEALLFGVDPGERWSAAFARAGVDARLLAATPGRA